MSEDDAIDRRTFVKGAVALAGGSTLAGCGGGADTGDAGGSVRDFGGWMESVGNYDGVLDGTGREAVTVVVGAEANGGSFGFEPAAVAVSPGTTVAWEWNGAGGAHNVVAADGSFESEMVTEAGHTFERTFDGSGVFRYVCEPHESLGMKGVVVVE